MVLKRSEKDYSREFDGFRLYLNTIEELCRVLLDGFDRITIHTETHEAELRSLDEITSLSTQLKSVHIKVATLKIYGYVGNEFLYKISFNFGSTKCWMSSKDQTQFRNMVDDCMTIVEKHSPHAVIRFFKGFDAIIYAILGLGVFVCALSTNSFVLLCLGSLLSIYSMYTTIRAVSKPPVNIFLTNKNELSFLQRNADAIKVALIGIATTVLGNAIFNAAIKQYINPPPVVTSPTASSTSTPTPFPSPAPSKK